MRRTRKIKRKQRGANKIHFVAHNNKYISGEAFKEACKYNLDDRYPIIPIDDTLQENDRVFIKQNNIPDLVRNPPSKKIQLVVHNTDETFDDSVMNSVRPYVNKVYAVNASATDAIQIPLGFRDDLYTPHKVLNDVRKLGEQKRNILCLLNFSMRDDNNHRKEAYDAFKNSNWALLDTNNTPVLHLDHTNPETIRLRKDFYIKLAHTKFVICPFGTGKDTHRVYEALFFGCIPVIKTSFLDPMYQTLGGCWIVGDWSEVTERECNKRWKNQSKIQADVNYWLRKS